MNKLNKSQLLAALEAVRQRTCCYTNSKNFCDCKYGVEPLADGATHSGERTGCCEIREAIALVSKTTDAEFKRVASRKMKLKTNRS